MPKKTSYDPNAIFSIEAFQQPTLTGPQKLRLQMWKVMQQDSNKVNAAKREFFTNTSGGVEAMLNRTEAIFNARWQQNSNIRTFAGMRRVRQQVHAALKFNRIQPMVWARQLAQAISDLAMRSGTDVTATSLVETLHMEGIRLLATSDNWNNTTFWHVTGDTIDKVCMKMAAMGLSTEKATRHRIWNAMKLGYDGLHVLTNDIKIALTEL